MKRERKENRQREREEGEEWKEVHSEGIKKDRIDRKERAEIEKKGED